MCVAATRTCVCTCMCMCTCMCICADKPWIDHATCPFATLAERSHTNMCLYISLWPIHQPFSNMQLSLVGTLRKLCATVRWVSSLLSEFVLDMIGRCEPAKQLRSVHPIHNRTHANIWADTSVHFLKSVHALYIIVYTCICMCLHEHCCVHVHTKAGHTYRCFMIMSAFRCSLMRAYACLIVYVCTGCAQ